MLTKSLLFAMFLLGTTIANSEILKEEYVILKTHPDKPFILPRVPNNENRAVRTGARRLFSTLQQRCYHMTSCVGCECCGRCSNDSNFLCNSPPGSVDICALTDMIKSIDPTHALPPRKTVSYSLPADFPTVVRFFK